MDARIAGFIDNKSLKIVSTLDVPQGRKVHRSVANLVQHSDKWGWVFEAEARGDLVPFDWTPEQGVAFVSEPTSGAAAAVETWLVGFVKRGA